MKFDFRRLTPALVTSLALIFFALLCASIGWTVFAWLVGLLGLALNVVGIAVVQIDDASASSPASERNRGEPSGEQPVAGNPAGSADTAPAQGPVKTNPFADKAKSARAVLRNSASRRGRTGAGSTSTQAGSATSADSGSGDSATADPVPADQSENSPKLTDSPKITKRF